MHSYTCCLNIALPNWSNTIIKMLPSLLQVLLFSLAEIQRQSVNPQNNFLSAFCLLHYSLAADSVWNYFFTSLSGCDSSTVEESASLQSKFTGVLERDL